MSDASDGMVGPTPARLVSLRAPWMSVAVPYAIQEHVRFASALDERNGRAYTIRFASGGQGTIIEEPVDDRTAAALRELMEREYFAPAYASEAELGPLRLFLSARGVGLKVSSTRLPQDVVGATIEVCGALPRDHFGHRHFRVLELGGWGHGSAKASEHHDDTVHLFNFATKASWRNYLGLLLHEIGHAQYARIEQAATGTAAAIAECHRRVLAGTRSGATAREVMPFAIDFLLGPDSRVHECLIDIREFSAELYLMYVVRGRELRRAAAAMEPGLAEPWTLLYDAFRDVFGGVEYE